MVSGVATRYYASKDIGSRPVALLIHGYMESIESWGEMISLLEPHMGIVAFDLPGHGISETPTGECSMDYFADLACALLDKEGIEKAAVVGHSMGGYVAASFAVRYPNRCSALVLLNSSPLGDTPERAEARMREIKIIESGRKELLTSLNPSRSFAPENVKRMAETIDGLTEQAMMTDDQGIVASLRGMMKRHDYSAELRKLPIPQAAIFGTCDTFIPEDARNTIMAATPQMKHLILSGTGHQSARENPQKVARIISDIIAQDDSPISGD